MLCYPKLHISLRSNNRKQGHFFERTGMSLQGLWENVGVTGLIEHAMAVQDSLPIKSQPYGRSPKGGKDLLKKVKIEPSGSP